MGNHEILEQTSCAVTRRRIVSNNQEVKPRHAAYVLGGEVSSDNAEDMRLLGYSVLKGAITVAPISTQIAVDAGRDLLKRPLVSRLSKAAKNLRIEAQRLRENAEKCSPGPTARFWEYEAIQNERLALACDRHRVSLGS